MELAGGLSAQLLPLLLLSVKSETGRTILNRVLLGVSVLHGKNLNRVLPTFCGTAICFSFLSVRGSNSRSF